MNLLDKLKPDYKMVLVEKMEEFPSTKESIFKALTQKEFVIQLTIKEACDTAYYLSDKSFAEIYELFKKE